MTGNWVSDVPCPSLPSLCLCVGVQIKKDETFPVPSCACVSILTFSPHLLGWYNYLLWVESVPPRFLGWKFGLPCDNVGMVEASRVESISGK